MKKLFTLIALVGSLSGFAALAPNQQIAREMKEILSSREIAENFPSGVRSVERIEGGYIVKSDQGTMRVDVLHFDSELYGPMQYKLRFHELDTKLPANIG